jgi:asparagine synthetase B (glutamine-hydrolysing)
VYLSGQGADEIMSDYGFAGQRIYAHSNFGGLFPEKLSDIFPWPSFFGSSQESYLMKEEHVAGSYGIEARYPFLDRRVVQEFLALDSRLKNSRYKSALRAYLENNSFPTAFDMKIGF